MTAFPQHDVLTTTTSKYSRLSFFTPHSVILKPNKYFHRLLFLTQERVDSYEILNSCKNISDTKSNTLRK
jgi:hypothetical protein